MKIQHTNITHHPNDLHIVDMLIADDPQPDEWQQKVHLVCHVTVGEKGRLPTLLELQRASLDDALSELEKQNQVLISAVRRPK